MDLNSTFNQRNPPTYTSLCGIEFLAKVSWSVYDYRLAHASHADLVNDPLKETIGEFHVIRNTLLAVVHVEIVRISEWHYLFQLLSIQLDEFFLNDPPTPNANVRFESAISISGILLEVLSPPLAKMIREDGN